MSQYEETIFGQVPMKDAHSWKLLHHFLTPVLPFFEDPRVTEILVNRFDEVYIEIDGVLKRVDSMFGSDAKLVEFIRQLSVILKQPFGEDSPELEARFPNGARISCAHSILTPAGASFSLRCKPEKPLTMDDLVGFGALTREMADFIARHVRDASTMLVTGNTGAGKTALLRACGEFIDPRERLCTAEDTLELHMRERLENVLAFEAPYREPKEGRTPITLAACIRKFLRNRPDRGWVGEIRDAAACDAFFQFVYTGHRGSAASLHSNGPHDTVPRLQYLMASAGLINYDLAGTMILKVLDLMVHCHRDPRFGRKITDICVVEDGVIKPVFTYDVEAGVHRRVD
ncbi:CpaF family protein (plasmid) [Pseudomonas syringae pv. pisi str. PP1]|uniref:CpaF family protein n=1 Tax=Pseudomonas syringae TaxID=317 RepID=UPI000465281D|nr:ATPase, T2SS/T4P/T4SS family [Pseudomonas syringae]AZG89391.1 CpaF family protein [Pseudomonas syringae pv. pisi str. PP1]